MIILLPLLLCAAPLPAADGHDHASHPGVTHGHGDMPIHPVHARMLVDPGLVRLRVVTDGAVLANELLGLDLPAADWPAPKLAQAKEWLDAHFTLAADGAPLESRLLSASYRIDAWKKVADVGIAGWDGMFIFELAFTLPDGAETLSGHASFYEEDWITMEAMLEKGAKPHFVKNFKTYLRVPGRKSSELEIGIENQEFTLPLETAMRAPWQRGLEAASWAWVLPWPILYALLALCILIAGSRPAYLIGAFLIAALFFAFLPGETPANWTAAGPWAALFIAGLLAAAKPQSKILWIFALTGIGGAFLGMGWRALSPSLAQIPMSLWAAAPAFLAGSIAAAVAAGLVSAAAYRGFKVYLSRESEQMASKLLEKNGRFAAWAMAAVGAVYAGRALSGL